MVVSDWNVALRAQSNPVSMALFALRSLQELAVPCLTQLCLCPTVWRRGAAAPVRAPHHAASAQPVRDPGHGRRAAGTELHEEPV